MEDGVDGRERSFTVTVGEDTVPGLLWTPAGGRGAATVLLGHGRTSDKRSPHNLELARRFVVRGWNAVALDAPGHGERRGPDTTDWPRPDPAQAVREWREALDHLRAAEHLETDRLGYWGVSMGTAFGLPLIASGPRVRAAVLGLMHLEWAPADLRRDAARVRCPVLFLVNREDTRVPRSRSDQLFQALGSVDKTMRTYPGEHGDLREGAMVDAEEFFARHL